jgi:hypothetical protein
MPRSIFSRASVENLTSLAAIVFLPRQLLVFMLPLPELSECRLVSLSALFPDPGSPILSRFDANATEWRARYPAALSIPPPFLVGNIFVS